MRPCTCIVNKVVDTDVDVLVCNHLKLVSAGAQA